MLRPLAYLVPLLALAAPAVATADAPAKAESAQPALPPTPSLPRQRRVRLTLAGLMATPRTDIDGGSSGDVEVESSPGFHFGFGYPADSNVSAVLDFRYLLLETGASGGAAGTDFAYYDIGLGARYNLAIGATTDFVGELMLMSSTLKASLPGGFGADDTQSGLGVLIRAGVVFLTTSDTSFLVTGSYSTASIKSSFNFDGTDRHTYPTFASVEFAVEMKL